MEPDRSLVQSEKGSLNYGTISLNSQSVIDWLRRRLYYSSIRLLASENQKMKVKFTKVPPNDSLLIIAESRYEAEELARWDNGILTAKFDYESDNQPDEPALLIVKEI